MATTQIPATSEVLLKTDASKQFLDTLLGQGWDAWGAGIGGPQAAELMLQMFSAFNMVTLAVMRIASTCTWESICQITAGQSLRSGISTG